MVLLLMGNTDILNSWLWKTYLFSVSEVEQLNSRNFCRGLSWRSHLQQRFLLEKFLPWALQNKRGPWSNLCEQLKTKKTQLCSKYYCLINTSA